MVEAIKHVGERSRVGLTWSRGGRWKPPTRRDLGQNNATAESNNTVCARMNSAVRAYTGITVIANIAASNTAQQRYVGCANARARINILSLHSAGAVVRGDRKKRVEEFRADNLFTSR